jgi:uncharacterized membrane protein YhaH (DUF805 family)
MVEIIERLLPKGELGITIMALIGLIFIMLLVPLLGLTAKILHNIYRADKQSLVMLQQKTILHDQEHVDINNNITRMLTAMEKNREADQEQARITRELMLFIAKRSNIEIPHL